MNIRWFPFDDQNCDMMFGTWSYDGSKISLKLKDGVEEASLEGYSKSGEWDLLGLFSLLSQLWIVVVYPEKRMFTTQ